MCHCSVATWPTCGNSWLQAYAQSLLEGIPPEDPYDMPLVLSGSSTFVTQLFSRYLSTSCCGKLEFDVLDLVLFLLRFHAMHDTHEAKLCVMHGLLPCEQL